MAKTGDPKSAKWSLIGDLLGVESDRVGTELVVGDLELVAKWNGVPQTGVVELDGGTVFSPPNELKAPGVMRRGTDYGVVVEMNNYVRASKAYTKSAFPNGMVCESRGTVSGVLPVPSGRLAFAVAVPGVVNAHREEIPAKLGKPLQLGLRLFIVPVKTARFEVVAYDQRFNALGGWRRWELIPA